MLREQCCFQENGYSIDGFEFIHQVSLWKVLLVKCQSMCEYISRNKEFFYLYFIMYYFTYCLFSRGIFLHFIFFPSYQPSLPFVSCLFSCNISENFFLELNKIQDACFIQTPVEILLLSYFFQYLFMHKLPSDVVLVLSPKYSNAICTHSGEVNGYSVC